MDKIELSNYELALQLASDLSEYHIEDLEQSQDLESLDKAVNLLLNQLEDFNALQVLSLRWNFY